MYVAADADLCGPCPGRCAAASRQPGQLCISKERILVHESIADEFTARFVEAVKRMRLGTELAYGPDMGSLVSAEQLARVEAHVEDARAKGAVC